MEKMGPPQLFFIAVDRFSIGFLDIAVGGARARRVVHFYGRNGIIQNLRRRQRILRKKFGMHFLE